MSKSRDLRNLNDAELDQKLSDARHELTNLHFQSATGALDSSARLGVTKREIARILTIQNERGAGVVTR